MIIRSLGDGIFQPWVLDAAYADADCSDSRLCELGDAERGAFEARCCGRRAAVPLLFPHAVQDEPEKKSSR